MNYKKYLSILFFVPMYLSASITGTYDVAGFDPATNQNYTGTVVITKQNSIYTFHWDFSGSTDVGTGVKKGNSIAVVFQEDGNPSFGTNLYIIQDDVLKGPWARFGATSKGFEQLTKKHHHHHSH